MGKTALLPIGKPHGLTSQGWGFLGDGCPVKPTNKNDTMKTKTNTNDARQRLESFFANVIWIPNPHFQKFSRNKFERYKDYIAEVDWFGSGGGCYHLLFRLKSGHIIAMHTESNVCEHSFDAWESIKAYCSEESNDECKGFGWEYESPNYHKRCQVIE